MPYLVKIHGRYSAQRKVPEDLQREVARLLGTGRERQVYLKRSLGTADAKQANVRIKHVLIEFDRIISEARALKAPQTPAARRDKLSRAEIDRMAETLYGKLLADDEAFRFGGRAHIAATAEWIRRNEKPDFQLPYPLESVPEYGWDDEQLQRQKERMTEELETMRDASARGDITAVQDDVALLLADFEIDLDPKSPAYRELGMQALRAYVRALQAIDMRNAGEPVETPKFTRGPLSAPSSRGGTLRDAVAGWEKERARPAGPVHEYKRAVAMFIELHGDMPVAEIKRTHVLEFRQALQSVPRARGGKLRNASLPELNAWARKHPEAPKVSPATVNKQLGAVQAVANWAYHHGIIPDDVASSDPFQRMKVEEDRSERGPFDARELQRIFDAPLFTTTERPQASQGAAGVWLPLLALFTGARRAELAGLKVQNVTIDEQSGTPLLFVVQERKAGKRLKTRTSERVVPVHPQLVELGFLEYVEACRRDGGEKVWLFPSVAPDKGSAQAVWGKWWSRYLRKQVGIVDPNKVFHSFRHKFSDGATRAGVDRELRQALMGHSDTSVSGGYGSAAMLERFGVKALADAVAKISYPGLDLSRVRTMPAVKRTRTRGNK